MYWLTVEWLGTLMGLSGSLIMASKKMSQFWAWSAWILSSIFFISLFTINTQQFGLAFMNIVGLFIAVMGMWQWSNKRDINLKLMHTFFYLSMGGILISSFMVISIIFAPAIRSIEWFGSIMSISASLLLASKHQKSYLCWIVWLFANFALLSMTIYTQQWGVATLQLGFTISNLYGCWVWIIKHSSKQTFKEN